MSWNLKFPCTWFKLRDIYPRLKNHVEFQLRDRPQVKNQGWSMDIVLKGPPAPPPFPNSYLKFFIIIFSFLIIYTYLELNNGLSHKKLGIIPFLANTTRECDFSHTTSHSSWQMCDVNFVDEITYCNGWNHNVYLTHVLWAIAFCVGKITFSCSANFCILRSNLKQISLHTRDCENFRGRMEMLELLICFSYMNRCYLAHPYYYVTFGQD